MTLPANIRVNIGAPFPSLVKGGGLVAISKKNGIWTVSINFGGVAITPVVPDPANTYVPAWNALTGVVSMVPIAQGQFPVLALRKPASAANVAILAADVEVGIDTRTTAVNIGLPGAAAWAAANPFSSELVIIDYYGNAFNRNITPTLNGGDTFAGAYAAAPPLINANSGLLRLSPDITAGVVVGWIVRGVN